MKTEQKLFLVQDSDRPMYVIAESFDSAHDAWLDLMCEENECERNDVEPCHGIQRVAASDEFLVTVAARKALAAPTEPKGTNDATK